VIRNVNGISLSIICICAVRQAAKGARLFQIQKSTGASAIRLRIPFAGTEPAARKPNRQFHAKDGSGPPHEPFKNRSGITEPICKNRRANRESAVKQAVPGKEKNLKLFFIWFIWNLNDSY